MFSIIAVLTETMLGSSVLAGTLCSKTSFFGSNSLCSSASVPGHGLLCSINSSGFLREGSGPADR
jgi:hypothetical protein